MKVTSLILDKAMVVFFLISLRPIGRPIHKSTATRCLAEVLLKHLYQKNLRQQNCSQDKDKLELTEPS